MPPPHLAQLGVWRPCVCVHTCWDLCVHGPVCLEVDAASPQHPRVCRQLVSSQADARDVLHKLIVLLTA